MLILSPEALRAAAKSALSWDHTFDCVEFYFSDEDLDDLHREKLGKPIGQIFTQSQVDEYG